MERVKIRTMVFITVFMVLIPKIMSAPPTSVRSLCLSQFALANHACGMLPFHHDHMTHSLETKDGHDQEQQKREQEDGDQIEREHGQHGHGNCRDSTHHHHHHSGVEVDCCRWLKEVDTLCVCEVLLHLPPFLKLPTHSYTVSVAEECNVTFKCPGRSG